MSQCMVGVLCQTKGNQPLISTGASMYLLYSGKDENTKDYGRIES